MKIVQQSGDGGVSSFLCRKKETHSHIHTCIHSTSSWTRMNIRSFPRSLAMYPHTRANKKKSSASSFGSGTWIAAKVTLSSNVKMCGWWKVTWSIACHWTVSSLIEACHKSSNGEKMFLTHCWYSVQIKTHHVQVSGFSTSCLYTARTCNKSTRPKYGPAIMDVFYMLLKLASGWHITMTMKQYAICCSSM